MRGLDGNYINTQGDTSARIQVVYQAEQNRQQIRAQVEATDALRKLREQVNETEKKSSSAGPVAIRDDQGKASGGFSQGGFEEKREEMPARNNNESVNNVESTPAKQAHIDIRV